MCMPPKTSKSQRKAVAPAANNQDLCCICTQKIGPKDEVLFCSGTCQKYLHRYCSVGDSSYKALTYCLVSPPPILYHANIIRITNSMLSCMVCKSVRRACPNQPVLSLISPALSMFSLPYSVPINQGLLQARKVLFWCITSKANPYQICLSNRYGQHSRKEKKFYPTPTQSNRTCLLTNVCTNLF